MNIAVVRTVRLLGIQPSEDAEKPEGEPFPASALVGRRFFLCNGHTVTFDLLERYPHSHIIGELKHMEYDDRRIIALAVYETSLPVNDQPVIVPPIRVEIIGDARRIKCTRCPHCERWEIGKGAFLAFMRRYRKDIFGMDV